MSTVSTESAPRVTAGVGRSFFHHAVPLGLCLLVALGIRLCLLEHPLVSDDTTYFSLAPQYSAKLLKSATHVLPYRMGLLFPIRLSQSIFGFTFAALRGDQRVLDASNRYGSNPQGALAELMRHGEIVLLQSPQ